MNRKEIMERLRRLAEHAIHIRGGIPFAMSLDDGIALSEAAELLEDAAFGDRKHGIWKDYRDEGFLECPFCEAATSCDDNADELLYCFSCGARLTVPEPLIETADGCMEDKTE